MITAFLLGRTKEISTLEIEAVLKRHSIAWVKTPISEDVLGVSTNKAIDPKIFFELGGSVRMMEIVAVFDKNSHESIEQKIIDVSREYIFGKEAKSAIGFSATSFSFSKPRLLNIAKKVKKLAKESGERVQFILPGKGVQLSAAQVIKHDLTDTGLEFVLISGRDKIFMGRTIAVQDIDAWAQRDVGKPAREQKKGMIPPKLARMMLNIALPIPLEPETPKILDPFCGTGTVLMEAMELGIIPFGVDLDPDQTAAARKNIDWMNELMGRELDPGKYVLHADARNLKVLKDFSSIRFEAIVTEPYLGPALVKEPSSSEQIIYSKELSRLYSDFLQNARSLLKPRARVVMAFPKWSKRGAFDQVVDKLPQFGYDLINDLLYHREGQFVSRQIIVLKGK